MSQFLIENTTICRLISRREQGSKGCSCWKTNAESWGTTNQRGSYLILFNLFFTKFVNLVQAIIFAICHSIDYFFLKDKELKWNRIDLSKCEQFFIYSKKLLLINILLFQFAHKLYWNILFQHKHSPNYVLFNLNNCIKIIPN